MSLIIDEHREYLRDRVRLEAFRRAIGERVRPGDVVVDLGAGTGILGLLACEAGAARVYAIESSGMIDVARAVARANGLDQRIVHVPRQSTDATLPERVDGLVCDQIGRFGFDAGLIQMLADARRFLKPGAWTVPESVELQVAPVEEPDVRGRIDFWSSPVCGLDFSPVRSWAANTGYPKHLDSAQLLGPPAAVCRIDLPTEPARPLVSRTTLRVDRAGTFDGVGGWFAATLSPGTVLTNAPGAPARLHRRNVVLPVSPGIPVEPEDTVELRLQILPADLVVTWRGSVKRQGSETSFSRSTLSGMLLTRDDLRRLRPEGVPRLTERGRARLSVLELCDGDRTLSEIEREVRARHPSLFRSDEEAGVFVAEVVSRYSE